MIMGLLSFHRRYTHDHDQLPRSTSVNVAFRIWRAIPFGSTAMILGAQVRCADDGLQGGGGVEGARLRGRRVILTERIPVDRFSVAIDLSCDRLLTCGGSGG